jgi:biofilm PGA synthesis N-glycosyltransferase PgaC
MTTAYISRAMNKPRIGVLIPAYNEETVLKGTIDALVEAGAQLADIYVVDDRSTDRTAEIAVQLGIHIYTVPVNGGKARAQVQALAHFGLCEKYEWLAFLDGDTKVDKDFFNEMIKAVIADPGVALFLGQVKSVQNNHIYSASRAFDYTYGQDVAKVGQDNFNVVFVAPGCASLYRTDVLKQLKINHMTLAEDMDLTMQVHRTNHRVSYVSTAYVNTQDPATFKDYHKQTLRWFRGFWQVTRIHNIFNPFTRKQRVDWYMIMLSADAIIFNRVFWLAVLVYMISWKAGGFALGIDIATAGVISFYCGWKTKRWDVITKFPLYYWINYVNFYAYTRAFIEIVILRKELLAWNKVARYSFDDADKNQQVDTVGK